MNDKRSDFPCPGIIRSGSYSKIQSRETRAIQAGVEAKMERRTGSAADERRARNEEYLGNKRRKPTRSIRRPS